MPGCFWHETIKGYAFFNLCMKPLYFRLGKKFSTNHWKFGDTELHLSPALGFQGFPYFDENMPKGIITGLLKAWSQLMQ